MDRTRFSIFCFFFCFCYHLFLGVWHAHQLPIFMLDFKISKVVIYYNLYVENGIYCVHR